jgi:hypothetical protein
MDLVTVGTFSSVLEAELAKERLASEGIAALVADGGAGGVMPFLASSSGVRVQVAESEAERAKEILGPSDDGSEDETKH